jgi:hypothetical protein
MPETLPTYDPAQRAHLKTHTLADADLISNYGGEYDEHGHLGIDPSKQAELDVAPVSQDVIADAGSHAVSHVVEKPAGSEVMSRAELEKFAHDHVYSVGMEGPQGYTMMVHQRTAREPILQALGNFESDMSPDQKRDEEKRFNDLGVAEVASLIPAETFFGDPNAAGFSIIEYKTLVKGQDKYIYDPQTLPARRAQRRAQGDSRKPRGGQYFGFRIAAESDEAQKVWETLQQEPQLVRELADMMVMDPELQDISQLGQGLSDANRGNFQQKWQEQVRPPYDEWKEANGGVNRMAFRASPDQAPEQCEIAEF